MRLLIVEDEPDLLRALARALREDGYAVDTAEDGEDGRFKALECDYDAIVLDWMLPVMSGLEVLKALRARKKTPVLMLTAKNGRESSHRGPEQRRG
jgi:two-component system OmpR family response regulator